MRRKLSLLALSLGLAHQAHAQVPDQAGGARPSPVASYLAHRFGLKKAKAEEISNAVDMAAAKYSLPPAMLLAIISIESRFREKARGANGATGLMQVVPAAHRDLLHHVKNLADPGTNIDVGSAILRGYVRSAGGDIGAALKSYGGSHAYAEKILTRFEEFVHILAPHHDAQAGLPASGAAVALPVVQMLGASDAQVTEAPASTRFDQALVRSLAPMPQQPTVPSSTN